MGMCVLTGFEMFMKCGYQMPKTFKILKRPDIQALSMSINGWGVVPKSKCHLHASSSFGLSSGLIGRWMICDDVFL